MKHRIKASSAGLWTKCAGSAKLAGLFALDIERSEARKEGTAAHKVIEMLASGETVKDGMLTDEGYAIDESMIEGAQLFLETVGAGATHETKVDCSAVMDGLIAYPDAFRYDRDTATVHIWSYKYGHSFVDAFENAQMLVEASGMLQHEPAKFVFTVVQPRCYHAETVRSWEVDADTYRDQWLPMLRDAAVETQEDDPSVETGNHCALCPARHACKALQQVAATAIDASTIVDGSMLSGDALGTELSVLHSAVKRIEDRIKGLEEQAVHELEQGRPILGYELKQSYGHTDWTIEKDKVIALGDVLGIDLRKPAAPVSPSQAKKLGFEEKTLEGITQRPFRGAKLKPLDLKKMKGVFDNE